MRDTDTAVSAPRRGNNHARVGVRELYAHYHQRLLAFLKARHLSEEDAADIAHSIFLCLIEMDELPEGSHLENMIFTIAHRMTVSDYRKKRVRQNVLREGLEVAGFKDSKPLPDQVVAGKQDWQQFRNSLDSLPPRCREVYLMHKVDGFTQKDVARKLDISLSAVEKHMIKAVMKINQLMGRRK